MSDQHTKRNALQHPSLKFLDKVAMIMDDGFRIPGTKMRIGLDPIISMLPVAGDTASFLMSALAVIVAARHGASTKVVGQMVGNILVDYIAGTVPVVGDMFDFAFKANRRNYKLMKQQFDTESEVEKQKPRSKALIIAMIVGMFLVFALVTALMIWVLGQLFS
ncbi:DUF4112 domain-containing protein [Limibacter armeniacum]|uniref:DUF4112 domain-containing protein n=1 Tax=Limibacter armeniacum TaxID=466084 RepID=UPI002FE67B06